jgi:hypothetical protein
MNYLKHYGKRALGGKVDSERLHERNATAIYKTFSEITSRFPASASKARSTPSATGPPSSTPPANPPANNAASFWTCYASSPQTPFSNAPVDPNPAPKNADPKITTFSQNLASPWAMSSEETAPAKIQGKIPNQP